ncbi:fibroblast growth factor 1-like isoform X1 [Acropora muricata]|uniref:fibroblast growth factor 1-like isoform X1 n=1 Tax=Acropora muricata TaxID=159855 RepID=UPI0034E4867C
MRGRQQRKQVRNLARFLQVVLTNGLWWLLLSIIVTITVCESVPEGSQRQRTGSGSDQDSEVEETNDKEQEIYRRLTDPHVDKSSYKKVGAYLRTGKLFNRNGYVLRINADGTVDGTTERNSPFARLEFHSVGTGLLMMLGIASQRYLSISDKGRLQGVVEPSRNTVFREVHETNWYHSYFSYEHSSWLIGIKKNGRAKRGQLTRIGQKSTQFLITYD